MNVLKKALSHIMKKIILSLLVLISGACYAQNAVKLGPTEQKLNDALCDCMSKKDLSKVVSKEQATAVFNDCITQQLDLVKKLATERKLNGNDPQEMNALGVGVAKTLVNSGCAAALQVIVKMGGATDIEYGLTQGTFKRLDTKRFAYIVVTDVDNTEKSLAWLNAFEGSENFIKSPEALIGKQLDINWQEIELYSPETKSYEKVKVVVQVKMR